MYGLLLCWSLSLFRWCSCFLFRNIFPVLHRALLRCSLRLLLCGSINLLRFSDRCNNVHLLLFDRCSVFHRTGFLLNCNRCNLLFGFNMYRLLLLCWSLSLFNWCSRLLFRNIFPVLHRALLNCSLRLLLCGSINLLRFSDRCNNVHLLLFDRCSIFHRTGFLLHWCNRCNVHFGFNMNGLLLLCWSLTLFNYCSCLLFRIEFSLLHQRGTLLLNTCFLHQALLKCSFRLLLSRNSNLLLGFS